MSDRCQSNSNDNLSNFNTSIRIMLPGETLFWTLTTQLKNGSRAPVTVGFVISAKHTCVLTSRRLPCLERTAAPRHVCTAPPRQVLLLSSEDSSFLAVPFLTYCCACEITCVINRFCYALTLFSVILCMLPGWFVSSLRSRQSIWSRAWSSSHDLSFCHCYLLTYLFSSQVRAQKLLNKPVNLGVFCLQSLTLWFHISK